MIEEERSLQVDQNPTLCGATKYIDMYLCIHTPLRAALLLI